MHRSVGMSMFVAVRCAMVMGLYAGVRVIIVSVISCGVNVVVDSRIMVFNDNINFGAGETAAHHFAHFEPRSDVQLRRRLFEQGKRNARVDKSAEQHVAADAREAF
jgi:hypothetical protein